MISLYILVGPFFTISVSGPSFKPPETTCPMDIGSPGTPRRENDYSGQILERESREKVELTYVCKDSDPSACCFVGYL